MNEEQQKVVEKEIQVHLEQGFHGMIDDMLYSCLDRLRDKDLLPDLETPDGPNPEANSLQFEIELLAACGTITMAQKYLQNRREAFPEFLPKRKVAIVEIEYNIEEDVGDDETFELIIVNRVLVDGEEVDRPGEGECWPILRKWDSLELRLVQP